MGPGPVPMSLGRWMCSARASLSVCERAEGVCIPPARFEDAIYCRLSQPRASWSIGRHLTPCTQHFLPNRCSSGAVRRVVAAGLPRVCRRSTAGLPQVVLRSMADCRMPNFMSVGFAARCLSCGVGLSHIVFVRHRCLTLHFVRWVSTTYFSSCGMLMPHIDACVVILASTMQENE